MINNIPYGIPCTTQQTSIGYPGYLRNSELPEHGLNLRFMIPVPVEALEPPLPLPPVLALELMGYEQVSRYIEEEARLLYRLSVAGQMDHIFARHGVDHAELESVYRHWTPGFETGLFFVNKEDNNMPVSKNGKPYYTKEQYEAARYNSSALEYAKSRGYDLVRQGSYYTLREHDSMIFTPQGSWFWNSRGLHGTALEFQIYYEGKTLTEAVLTLAGEQTREQAPQVQATAPVATPATVQETPDPTAAAANFRMPMKAANNKAMFHYLISERGIEKSIVFEMIRQGRLYQSMAVFGDNRKVYNATFVYRDPDGKPVGAFQRGMMEKEGTPAYKRDVSGSDKQYGWMLAGRGNVNQVAVFEGAIDAASDASIDVMSGRDWATKDRLSLEGLGSQPLFNYLAANTGVQKVILMLDGDAPGRRAAAEIAEKLKKMGLQVEDRTPPMGKDWNETLMELRADQAELDEPIPPGTECPEE